MNEMTQIVNHDHSEIFRYHHHHGMFLNRFKQILMNPLSELLSLLQEKY